MSDYGLEEKMDRAQTLIDNVDDVEVYKALSAVYSVLDKMISVASAPVMLDTSALAEAMKKRADAKAKASEDDDDVDPAAMADRITRMQDKQYL